ncbi:hypothetical protein [Stenotrophomonas sp. JAI102]|uniref:hypothetical protein n=1 Tax=Stenotrophomonas sp. JAI102 TaxID=2723077 RepID=UPI001855E535|nr:hypothetical protein [Stenotrophomonas sp. JAI102]NYF35079.1 hypothetical protein [Stenotrophomonas sp. JAI102]
MKRIFLCWVLWTPSLAMAAPGAFAPQLSGFEGEPLISADGRLLVAPNAARMVPLSADRWYRTGWYNGSEHGRQTRPQWFDGQGHMLRESSGGIRYGDRLEGSNTLWKVELRDEQDSYLGTGLADAQGKVHFQPTRESGDWRFVAPDRIAWQGRRGGARIFSLDGLEVLRIQAHEIWVGGPFAGRKAYVICGDYEMASCRVQEEGGAVLFEGDFDEARAAGEGWWLRKLDTWRRVDAAGVGVDRARYQGIALWPHYRSSVAADSTADQPLEVRRHANGLDSDTPERGWLLDDGHFAALPASGTGMIVEYCPGRWLLRTESGVEPIVDARGKVRAQTQTMGFNEHPELPWRLRQDYGGNGAAILDCEGSVLFEQSDVLNVRSAHAGAMGTLAGEEAPRLWIDAALRPHLLPSGLRLQERYVAPPLLVAEDVEGNSHLYNTSLGKVVAPSFGAVEELTPTHLIFLRDGRYGMLLPDGRELLPPIYAQILPLSAQRVWARQDVGRDGDWRSQVTLFDGALRMLVRRTFDSGGMDRVSVREGGEHVPEVLALSLGSMTVGDMTYGLKQWLGGDGQVLASAVHCVSEQRGQEGESGVLLGSGWRVDSDPQRPCQVPTDVMQALRASDL